MTSVLAGSAIGLGIGMSAGAIFYFALLNLKPQTSRIVCAGLMALVAAGMIAQATQSLIQADWLPSQYPLWDSSWLADEQSVTGQLLYALIGYEATPTALQASFYFGGFILLLVVVAVALKVRRQSG